MFKLESFLNKTFKAKLAKITLSILIISLGLQTMPASAVITDSEENTGFFGEMCTGVYNGVASVFNGVSSVVEGIDKKMEQTKKIIRYGKYAAYGITAILGYFTVLRPASRLMFGQKGKTATSFIDFGLKWSFIAAIIAIPVCAFLYFNNNKLNKLSQDIKQLNQKIDDRADKTDAQLYELKTDGNNQHKTAMQEIVRNGKDTREIKSMLSKNQTTNSQQANPDIVN